MNKDKDFKFQSIFKKELSEFIIYKRSNGYKYSKPVIYRLCELDKFLLSLNNNNITSIACLEDFKNVYLLRVETNNLTTLRGVKNQKNI